MKHMEPGAQMETSSDEDDVDTPKQRNRKITKRNQGEGSRRVGPDSPNPKWKVEKEAIGFCINRLAKAGIRMKGKKLCFKYHSQGSCTANCAFRYTHDEMDEELERTYHKFMMKTIREWQKLKAADANIDSDEEENKKKKKPKQNAEASE
jgi:hypothetical protein